MLLWIEYDDYIKIISIFLILALVLTSFFKNSLILKFKFAISLILYNPILNSLLYNGVESRVAKLIIFVLLFSVFILISIEALYKIVKPIIIINIAYCLILIFSFYNSKSEYKEESKPLISNLITKADYNKDIYIILLDGFPSPEILQKYFKINSKFLGYLNQNNFIRENYKSKYYYTHLSIPNIFSGVLFNKDFEYKTTEINKMRSLIPGKYITNFAKNNNVEIVIKSLLLDKRNSRTKFYFGRGSDFEIYIYSILGRVLGLSNSFIVFNKKSSNSDDYLNSNLTSLISTLNKKNRIFAFYHFLTFHTIYYNKSFKQAALKQLDKADKIGVEAVSLIIKKQPSAKIIVISDHGLRDNSMEEVDKFKGILYIRN